MIRFVLVVPLIVVLPVLAAQPSQVESGNAKPKYEYSSGALEARLLVFEMVDDLDNEATADLIAGALRAFKGVLHAYVDTESNLVQVFAAADSDVTADHIQKYLQLAGYETREATAKQLQIMKDILQTGAPIDVRTPARSPTIQAQKGTVDVTSLAESVEPLRRHFNENKHKHRFVALLSPT